LSANASDSLDTTALQDMAGKLATLTESSWIIRDVIGDLRISTSTSNIDITLADIQIIESAVRSLEITGRVSGYELRIRTIQGDMEVVDVPSVDPYTIFAEAPDLANAREAWEHDVDAALKLPLEWHVTAFLKLEQVLTQIPEDVDLSIAMTSGTILRHFHDAGFVNLSRCVPAEPKRRVYVSLTEDANPVHLGAISFITATRPTVVTLPALATPLPAESLPKDASLVLPCYLLPIDSHSNIENAEIWKDLTNFCRSAAAAATWVMLASDVNILDQRVDVEFFGYRRIQFKVPELREFNTIKTSGALHLREWAFQEVSPDRLLAIRQVVSLYDRDNPFDHAPDIKTSAELIYVGLRSDAVTEVVKSSRDAQSQAYETVRQALKSSQDLIKSAMERFLAGLVAVGAVTIANASRVLADDISRLLMLFVAAFFAVLAIVAVAIEGPLLSLQMKHLDADVQRSTSLLTSEQRKEITQSSSVQATRLRLRLVRLFIPLIYVLLIVTILLWGYP
jgi:hypothetical protein